MRFASRVAVLPAVLVLSLVLGACRSPVPSFLPLSADDPRPQRLLAAWKSDGERRHSLRGRARLSVKGPSLRLQGKQVVLVQRPDQLRVEVQGLFGQTLAVLVIDGRDYALLQAGQGAAQRGRVYPGLLRELAGIDLEPEDVIALLLGVPAPAPPLGPVAAFANAAGDVRVDLGDASGRVVRRVRFDFQGRVVRVEAFGEAASPVWTADYGEFAEVGGVDFPHRLVLVTGGEARAEVALRDLELNADLPSDWFRLPRSAGPGSPAVRPPGS